MDILVPIRVNALLNDVATSYARRGRESDHGSYKGVFDEAWLGRHSPAWPSSSALLRKALTISLA